MGTTVIGTASTTAGLVAFLRTRSSRLTGPHHDDSITLQIIASGLDLEGTSALLAAGGIIGRNDVGAVSGCRNFGAVACALHAGALVGWNKKSVEDSAAGGSVNGTALTGTNYAELAVGFQDGGSSSGITFGEK